MHACMTRAKKETRPLSLGLLGKAVGDLPRPIPFRSGGTKKQQKQRASNVVQLDHILIVLSLIYERAAR